MRSRKLQQKLEIEMRDLSTGDDQTATYRRVGRPAGNYGNLAEEDLGASVTNNSNAEEL
jgi:hypothetical protein